MLLAYNLTAAPVTTAAGNPAVILPAAVAPAVRGAAVNVTGEMKSLTAQNYIDIQVQVAAGSIAFEWSTYPEYAVGTLIVALPGAGLVYTNVTRPLATTVPAGTMIFNSSDKTANWSDGTSWYDGSGVLT